MENAAVIKCGSVQFGEDKIVYFKKTFSAKKAKISILKFLQMRDISCT